MTKRSPMSEAHKAAMEEGRQRAKEARDRIADAVTNSPDTLTKPSVWKDVPDDIGLAIIAAITKARNDRLEARRFDLSAELEKINAALGVEV